MQCKSCFFIGHREAGPEILPALEDAIEKHISEYGVTEFIVGHYGGFDRLAARALVSAKKCHPEVRLFMLIPYHPAEHPVETPPGFDGTFYPPGMESVPRKFSIVQANRYMIDHVDYLIAYAWHPASNARNLIEYAERRNMLITNITDENWHLIEDSIKKIDTISLPSPQSSRKVRAWYYHFLI